MYGFVRILNACILVFVMSAANSDLYIGSRTLYALAAEGKVGIKSEPECMD